MKKVAFLIAALSVVAAANAQVTLYNGLGLSFDNGYNDTDGSINGTGGNFGCQVGQVITDSVGATSITQIESYEAGQAGISAATGLLVQVFNFSGGVVGSLVGQQTISSFNETDTSITSGGLAGFGDSSYDITATTDITGLTSGNSYLVTMQVQSPNEVYQGVSNTGNPDSYVRDYSSFGYPGLYGTTTWTEAGALMGAGYSVDSLMKVTGSAAPEPASLCVLGLGVVAMLRRRRRS